jgi:phosphatidate cytidylyltransferase
MVPRLAEAERSSLLPRIASALVLAPFAILLVVLGGISFQVLVVAAAATMAWEWARLCHGGALQTSGYALIAIVGAAAAIAAAGSALIALAVSVAGAAVVFVISRGENGGEPRWLAAGTVWLAVPSILLLWLAGPGDAGRIDAGRITVLWIFAVVWATDIGAYAAGRQIGGPRLAPRLSPRKTWAGLIGGMFSAALAGWATAAVLGQASALPLVLVSAGLAIVEQFGDLGESMAKRRFNVKDSSGLIPGHGGVLDRLDGLLAVIPAVALLTLFDNGRVLAWR